MSFDKEHLPEEKKGSVQRNETQQLNSSDSIYPKSMQKWVAGLPVHCATLSSLTVVPAHLQQPATSLALLWQGRAGGVVLCSSLFLILRSEISRTLISQDRGRQVLCKQVVPGTFPARTGFFFYYSLETLTLFFHCSPVSFFNRADDQ